MNEELVCIVCPNGCRLKVTRQEDGVKVEGARCARGVEFGKKEVTNPERVLCTTVKTCIPDHPMLSVKTSKSIPKALLFSVMNVIKNYQLKNEVHIGDVIIANILNTGADLIATEEIQEEVI